MATEVARKCSGCGGEVAPILWRLGSRLCRWCRPPTPVQHANGRDA